MIWMQLMFIFTLFLMFIIPQLSSFTLVAKAENRLILWPEYFDNSLSKRHGRRVRRKLATSSPTVEDIAKAAKKLKLNPKIEHEKSYPGRWWRKTGRVLVQATDKKTKIIRRIAIVMKKSKK